MSQVSIAVRMAGHSVSRIEYHAVSRFRPLTIMWLNPDTLEPEAQASGGCAAFLVQRVAAPLHSPVAEIVHRVCKQQEQCFGCARTACEYWREPDAADLDHSTGRLDVQIRGHADRATRRPVADCKEHAIQGGGKVVELSFPLWFLVTQQWRLLASEPASNRSTPPKPSGTIHSSLGRFRRTYSARFPAGQTQRRSHPLALATPFAPCMKQKCPRKCRSSDRCY